MKYSLLSCPLFLICMNCFGQKKPLDHSVYNSWQSIGEKIISNDGKWVAYTVDVQEGDNELFLESVGTGRQYKKSFPRGYNAVITEDSRFLVFSIKPPYKEVKAAKIQKAKPEEFPKDSLGILAIGSDELVKSARVKDFKTPSKSAGWLAYQLEKQPGELAKLGGRNLQADSLVKVIDSLRQLLSEAARQKAAKTRTQPRDALAENDFADDQNSGNATEGGTDLRLRNLRDGQETIFHLVSDYYFDRAGSRLLLNITRNPKDSLSNAMVLLCDLYSARTDTLSRGGNEFRNFSFSEDGTGLAYVAERKAGPKELQKFYGLWYYSQGMDSAILLADKNSVGMKLGMTVSPNGTLSFSKSGRRLFFGTAPIQAPKDTTLVDIDLVKLDIWHYKDDYLQTVQLKNLAEDLKRSYLAVYDLDDNMLTQIGSREIPEVIPTKEGDGDLFIGLSDYGKRVESQWMGFTRKNVYAIDVSKGGSKLIRENLNGTVYPSAAGRYILWYDREARNYFAWDGKETTNISRAVKVPLFDEENDMPEDPGPYGLMGWMDKDSAVYVYDRYDIWKLDPATGHVLNITKGWGRAHHTNLRYEILDPEKKYFLLKDTICVRGFNEQDKSASLNIFQLNGNGLPFNMEPDGAGHCWMGAVRADKSKTCFLYTKESFVDPPDLYVARAQPLNAAAGMMDSLRFHFMASRLTEINPQQKNYKWGRVELYHWKAYNGRQATGLLFKPEDYEPGRKYPLICYFYERLSDNLYRYYPPAPIRSAINIPFYTSRGYLIFIPDIEYRIGHPGKSAYDYVVSGARSLVKAGLADSSRMAIQGHSWGGYQVAQLVTMTKIFRAAWAGAPVANMTSAYGGIRWESGLNRQFQYEKSQSRIGATLWEKPELYIENSPLFHLKNVNTPLVIMHNDNDGAVPWYQGIELFTAMRRLNKQVWMFNYNGEGHGLTERKDKLDYQIRMQQFFDWILKGEKPVPWITDGLPATQKGKDWGLEP